MTNDYVFVRRSTGGRGQRVYHTDPNCTAAQRLKNPQRRRLEDCQDPEECKYCAGTFADTVPDRYGRQTASLLADMSPDQLGGPSDD
jgi:hypothetical protein